MFAWWKRWWRGWASPIGAPPTVELIVTDLAQVWLPYNREPWSEAAAAASGAPAPASATSPETGSPPAEASASAGVVQAGGSAAGAGSPATASGGQAAGAVLPEPFGSLLAPYVARAQAQGMWAVIERAVTALMEHGDGPSLVLERGSGDREAKDLYSVRDSLGRVTLRDHTAHVVHAMIEVVREQYRDADGQMPRALVAALAHDLGKIPAWRQVKAYGKQDHAAISAVKLREWVGGEEPWWLASVLAAVRDHHRRSADLLATMLRQADLRAREREVAATTAGLRVQAFPAWMDADRWRMVVAEDVDMLQKGNQWLAVTHHGVIYAKIELLLRAARTVMQERQVVDLTFLADGERERASAKLVKWIKEQGWLADEIGDGYYGLPYDVEVSVPHKPSVVLPPHYLVPLKVEAFGSEGAFRERKAGVLALITAVRQRPIAAAG